MTIALIINDDVQIPLSELEFTASRSSGPGGQHVNTTDSRIQVRWNLPDSAALSETEKARVRKNLASRLTEADDLILACVHLAAFEPGLRVRQVWLLDIYRSAPETWWLPIISVASLRFLARPLRVLIFGGLGVGLVAIGIWGMYRAIISPYIQPGQRVADALLLHRQKDRGPRIVAIGGGHGLAVYVVGHVTGGKHAGNVGPGSAWFDQQVPVVIHIELTLED
mgnify:CR=1 FL=1